MTRNQLISLGQKVSSKFRRTPSFSFILGAIDTEAPGEDGEKVNVFCFCIIIALICFIYFGFYYFIIQVERRQARRMERAKAAPATKTAIVERSQADGQMTDKLVTSTRCGSNIFALPNIFEIPLKPDFCVGISSIKCTDLMERSR